MSSISERTEVLKQITSCDNNRPYVFISYSSADADIVWRDVLEFQKNGYNVWLDEKNLNKEEASWREDALKAISDYDCHLVVFYVSRTSLVSGPCLKELEATISEETRNFHLDAPVNFIAIDVEENIGNITDYQKKIFTDIVNGNGEKAEKNEKIKNLASFIKEFFNNNNEKVRLEPNVSNRKTSYYDEIFGVFEKVGVLPQVVNVNTEMPKTEAKETSREVTKTPITVETPEKNDAEMQASENIVVNQSEVHKKIYYIKGAKYEAYLTNADEKFIVLKGSRIAKNWQEWIGAKDIEANKHKVGEGCILLEDAIFKSVSAAAKFVQGCSTNGANVFVDKNIVSEVGTVVTKGKEEKNDNVPQISHYPVKISADMTLERFAKLFEDDDFALYMRWFRANGTPGVSKQFVDYLMAALLRGCDQKAFEGDARWKYCAYAVSSNLDIENVLLGASQFTWQSNSRKAVNIDGSGKLGENSVIFSELSPETTIGEVQGKFEACEHGFVTKDNSLLLKIFGALYTN